MKVLSSCEEILWLDRSVEVLGSPCEPSLGQQPWEHSWLGWNLDVL